MIATREMSGFLVAKVSKLWAWLMGDRLVHFFSGVRKSIVVAVYVFMQ